MRPSLVNDTFTVFLAVWAGYILQRSRPTPFSLLHATLVLIFIAFLAFYIQATIGTEDHYEQIRILIPTIALCITTAFAVLMVDQLFYPLQALSLSEALFLPVIVVVWLSSHHLVGRLYGGMQWFRR